jgi:hypothetical protein
VTRATTAILALIGWSLALTGTAAKAAEPTVPQCLAANEDAQQLRRAGKLLQAQQRLTVCVARSCPRPIRDDCNTWLGEVSAAIPTIVLEARDTAGRPLVDVRVTAEGAALADSLSGRSIPIDPGPHTFVFDAPGLTAQTVTAVVFEGRKLQPVAATLRPLEVAPPIVSKAAETPSTPPAVSAEAPGRRTWPIALAFGFAGAGAAVAGISGGLAASAKGQCPNDVCPNQGVLSTAQTGARIADVGAAVAVAGVVAGVVLLLFLPSEKTTVTAHVGPGGGAVEVRFP